MSRAVVIRWFSLNEAPLGLFKLIFDYLPYFEKIHIFFHYHSKKKFELIYKDWSKLFVRFIRYKLNQVVHTLALCVQPDWGYFEWTEHKLRSILKYIVGFHRSYGNWSTKIITLHLIPDCCTCVNLTRMIGYAGSCTKYQQFVLIRMLNEQEMKWIPQWLMVMCCVLVYVHKLTHFLYRKSRSMLYSLFLLRDSKPII